MKTMMIYVREFLEVFNVNGGKFFLTSTIAGIITSLLMLIESETILENPPSTMIATAIIGFSTFLICAIIGFVRFNTKK